MSALSVAFADFGALEYDVTTPWARPVGGSESALCYLAIELARRGHRVVVLNNAPAQRIVSGVEMLPRKSIPDDYLRQTGFDALVVLNGPAEAYVLRHELPPRTVLAMWTGHDCDIAAIADLAQPEIRRGWEKIVCVSEWHRRRYLDVFHAEPKQVEVRRNAIGPRFESLFVDAADLRRRKLRPLRLAYTSTPFRGLDVLLDVFPHLSGDCRLAIYSSMRIYGLAPDDARFGGLYDKARQMPRVSYIGAVPQPELANALTGVSILSYPNTYPETSCIAVMEALAAGARVVTSDLGALPETTMGLAELVPNHQSVGLDEFRRGYLARLQSALAAIEADPQGAGERAYAQAQTLNAGHTWRVRAAEWEAMIARWRGERG
ncbi:MAG: glycosyltransferase family 4 protein [Alphaproteobacteria bacterium]|nr:glycosyltransferase family 4 protein [Alphaproteobacteria bacterium]